MFSKILVANRGEIALRIMRAAKELDIKTVAVYSQADTDSLHVKFADESVCIGPPPVEESYLNIPRIISAAEITGAECIHPGYGFLAENPLFSEICEKHHIRFIGPKAEVMRLMGNKIKAREIAKKAGVPIIPGSNSPIETEEEAIKVAKKIGYPLILKAAAGGGGKGMRIVYSQSELAKNIEIARREAQAAFGDPTIYIEKFLEEPRHIEIQILVDNYEGMVHLGERECSIQRNHQKLIEEAPSLLVTEKMRKEMGKVALKLAKAVGYNSVGTVEFLVDKKNQFYFIEMNTRIQVEHPVTELITGIDIIKEQIRFAAEERLLYSQKDIIFRGHALECRINAQDSENNFAPSPGNVTNFFSPSGPWVRMDTYLYPNCTIPPYYDSLIGKLIVYGQNREESISRMRRALDECVIEGIKTTIPLCRRMMDNEDFIKGRIHTGFLYSGTV